MACSRNTQSCGNGSGGVLPKTSDDLDGAAAAPDRDGIFSTAQQLPGTCQWPRWIELTTKRGRVAAHHHFFARERQRIGAGDDPEPEVSCSAHEARFRPNRGSQAAVADEQRSGVETLQQLAHHAAPAKKPLARRPGQNRHSALPQRLLNRFNRGHAVRQIGGRCQGQDLDTFGCHDLSSGKEIQAPAVLFLDHERFPTCIGTDLRGGWFGLHLAAHQAGEKAAVMPLSQEPEPRGVAPRKLVQIPCQAGYRPARIVAGIEVQVCIGHYAHKPLRFR